jgi:hypothetical protein
MDVLIVIAVAWAVLLLLGRVLMMAAGKGERPVQRATPRALRLTTTLERRPGHPVRAESRLLH